MAAYTEGLNILRHANIGKHPSASDGETTLPRSPAFYQYDMSLPQITAVWRRGSVIGSWLLDLTANALLKHPQLEAYGERVSDSGDGRSADQAGIDEAMPARVPRAAPR